MNEEKRLDEERSIARRRAIVHAEVVGALGDCSDALARIDRPGHGCWPQTDEARQVQRMVDDLIVSLAAKGKP